MRAVVFIILVGFLIISCGKTHEKITQKSKLHTDTTKTYYPSDKSTLITITTKLDTTIKSRITYMSKKDIRYEFFDNLGREFKQIDLYWFQNEEKRIYNWIDTIEYMSDYETFKSSLVMSVETTLVKNKIAEIYKRFRGGNIQTEYSQSGKTKSIFIYFNDDNYCYCFRDNEYYRMRTDVSREYLERLHLSKTDMGLANKRILELEILAKIKIKDRLMKYAKDYQEKNIEL